MEGDCQILDRFSNFVYNSHCLLFCVWNFIKLGAAHSSTLHTISLEIDFKNYIYLLRTKQKPREENGGEKKKQRKHFKLASCYAEPYVQSGDIGSKDHLNFLLFTSDFALAISSRLKTHKKSIHKCSSLRSM